MSDIKARLIQLGAAIARGEYHPSHCVEDYRKGMGRREFADLAGDYADRARGQVSVLTSARDRIADLEAENARLREERHDALRERDRLAEALREVERCAGLAMNACDDCDGMDRDPVLGFYLAQQAFNAARAALAEIDGGGA